MPEKPVFEPLRDQAFRAILIQAFKAFPSRVDQVMEAQGWKGFRDFMADVAHAGEVGKSYMRPRAKVIEERGLEAEIRSMLGRANTEAMMFLLASGFHGRPGLEPDPEIAREALEPLRIRSWTDFSNAVLEVALSLYADETGGGTPLDTAKTPTLLFYHMDPLNPDPHQIDQVVKAFGLSSPMHLEALLASFFSAETTVEDLDLAVGDPTRLTAILQASPSNPHKGLVFGNPGRASLSGPARGYAEELAASGIPVISRPEEYKAAFRRWGPPNIMLRPGAESVLPMFRRAHPDTATVFVDDSRNGTPVAVYIPEKSGGGPEMAGAFPGNPAAVMYFRDLGWPENSAGNLVAVSKFEWQDHRKAVIEGWRGPGLESEDFAKNQLELFACVDMQVDGAGYWRCARRW
jgi:hypothetical protein